MGLDSLELASGLNIDLLLRLVEHLRTSCCVSLFPSTLQRSQTRGVKDVFVAPQTGQIKNFDIDQIC